ncbi:hypothetical protein INR49_031796 [Caranx melampygus]|nr:hypothetical protein INR49_031796 [Caranx melampygus]
MKVSSSVENCLSRWFAMSSLMPMVSLVLARRSFMLKESPPSSTPLEVDTACRAALFCRTSRRDLANSSGPAMFSQQIAEDGGNQKRWVQLTGFPGVSAMNGLSAGKLLSRCRRDDPEPHSQSSRSGPTDTCSGGKVGRRAAGPALSAEKQTSNMRQQDRQSTALLTAPWSISKLAETSSIKLD